MGCRAYNGCLLSEVCQKKERCVAGSKTDSRSIKVIVLKIKLLHNMAIIEGDCFSAIQ